MTAKVSNTHAPSLSLTPEDALMAVQVMDAYLVLTHHISEMPGQFALNDDVRAEIKAVREILRGMIG